MVTEIFGERQRRKSNTIMRRLLIVLLALAAALASAFLGGDLFNLFVALEMLTFAALALACLEGKPGQFRAELRYLLFALVGSVLYLLGTALLTFVIGWIAPRFDLRALLLFGSALMIATGLVLPNVEHLTLIAVVAFIGTVNPSGGDLGVAVPLEHAVLARTASA